MNRPWPIRPSYASPWFFTVFSARFRVRLRGSLCPIGTLIVLVAMYRKIVLMPFALMMLPLPGAADSVWDDLRQSAANAAESTRETASKATELTGDTVSKAAEASQEFVDDTSEHFDRQGTPTEIREKVDAIAAATFERLFAENPAAKELLEKSYGYGVFDARQISFKVAAGYGYGVAVERERGERTYMKMATGGVGLSFGLGEGSRSNWSYCSKTSPHSGISSRRATTQPPRRAPCLGMRRKNMPPASSTE